MKSSRRIMLEQSILSAAFWITFIAAAPFELNGGPRVPEIGGCAYVDAYYVTCWWIRPEGDTLTQYRLGYTTDADQPHERREKYCEVTQQVTEGGVTIESCGIHGTMFQRFTLWIGSVLECDAKAESCVTTDRSEDNVFTCTRNNVKLTIPPSSLSVDEDSQRLLWYPPDKENSMLSFVLHRRHVMYKVEYREDTGHPESEWEEWYRGYETSVFLPTLIAGAIYEVRVSASLDSPILSTSITDYKREWTEPSTVLAFVVERALKSTSEGTIFESKEDNKISESTDSNVILEEFTRPIKISEKVVVAASASSFVIVLIMALVCYFVPWQRWCCNQIIKPKTFLDFAKSRENLTSDDTVDMGSSEHRKNEEKVFEISDVVDCKYETRSRARSFRDTIVFSLTKKEKEPETPDYTRQRLLSPSQNLERALSINDILDQIPLHDGTNTSHITMEKAHKEKNENFNGSVCYLKFGQESEMPNYLMTSKKGEMTLGSLDRSASEYVADDTGVESAFDDATAMTTFEEYEEKQKQWERFMLDQAKSDDVPDYVMQAPPLANDFSRGMSMFISMATEDLSKRQSTDIYDDTKTPLVHYDETMLPCLGDSSEAAEKRDSSLVIMTLCPSCKTPKKHDKCPSEQRKDNLGVGMTLNRRGSMSQHSIDSGYSPDSPDCAALPQGDKDNLLPQLFERRGSATVGDEGGSESDTDYMTHVST